MASTNKPNFRLVAGLGNPGREYAATRHNVGFMILDRLASKAGKVFKRESAWNAEVAVHEGVVLCKPTGYMNRSGEAVAPVSGFYKIPANEILLVLDDAALPLGRIRLRLNGSSGGHNGLQSVIDRLGTTEVARLRVGIGASDGRPMTDHVLGRFTEAEREQLEAGLDRAIEAIAFAQTNGAEAAMNKFN